MRLLWVLLAVALAAAAWLYFDPEAGRQFREELPRPEFTRNTDRLYKWRNEQGEWQYTDTPPDPPVAYETLDYRDDVNVLPVPPGIEGKP